MELNKCPNCSGKLELSASKKKMVCGFCGSEFAVDEKTKSTIKEGFADNEWFVYEWDYKKIKENPKLSETVTAFLRAFNEFESSSAKIEGFMRDYLMKYDAVSSLGLREEKMDQIKSRIAEYLTPGEKIILYDDDGIFAHGKTGVVITDKRTLKIEKKNITDIPHAGIPYLLFDYSFGVPGVKLGEKYSNSIGIFNSHFDLQGTAAALICAYSFEADPDRPKMRLLSEL